MYAISLPSRFATKLSKDRSASAFVFQALLLFEPWLKASGMPFFPGFTDHGPDHLQRVIDTADWLIPNESWKLLSARDVACLTVATLLHDSAMHITEDGFRALILDRQRSPLLPDLDRETWDAHWGDYLLEAQHWTRGQRVRILGPEWQGRAIDELHVYRPDGLADLSESDRLFIGEFIRRHHPRLAHEFAVNGVLGPLGGLKISAPDDLPQLLDLSGIVARSHGMSIRDTFAWLSNNHGGIGPLYAMVPVYHMGILRIADYLDLHAERAPSNLLKVKALRSAVSQREWAAHAAITDIRYGGTNDPERLEIIADPRSAAQYTSVLSWVNGIQEELDHTWAVLGEVYGGVKQLSKLGLRLRRISSPLEDCDKYASDRNLQFVPKLARFRAAEPTLLPLLTKPLYGDRPEVGIRELLQNAIDAVNERESLESSGNLDPESTDSQCATVLRSLGADVVIDVCSRGASSSSMSDEVPDDWEYWVEVVDRGVGMTPRIVTDYFLCAGATFRRSLEWQRTFVSNKGLSVVRSGQFGIGTLALFTLGEEICVSTRHYSEEAVGTHFRASLSEEEIELQRRPVPLGTSIRICITEKTFQRLAKEYDSMRPQQSWDWFCLDKPRIVCRVRRGNEIEIQEQRVVASLKDAERSGWRSVECDRFERVIWRPAKESWRHRLYANGILVAAWHRNFDRNWFSSVPEMKQPDVIVIDPSSNLELRLTRDDVVGELGYTEAVQRDVLLDHCAWLLSEAAMPARNRAPFNAPMWEKRRSMSPGDGVAEGPSYLVMDTGLVPFTAWHIQRADVQRLNVYFTSTGSYRPSDDKEGLIHFPPTGIFEHELLPAPYASMRLEPFGGFGPVSHARVAIDELSYFMRPIIGQDADWVLILPTFMAKQLDNDSLNRSKMSGSLKRTQLTSSNGEWTVLNFGSEDIDLSPFISVILGENSPLKSNNAIRGFAQFNLKNTNPAPENELAKLWLELDLPPVLPFDASRRRELCGQADAELSRHTARYSSNAAEQDAEPDGGKASGSNA